MNEYTVDVVIVGAGPAGSVAAWKLAQKGVNVLVLDKKQEIGAPKRCAEGLSYMGMKHVGIEPDPKWAVQEIHSSTVIAPSGAEVLIKPPNTLGYVLERKVFEKHLAAQAINAGARYMIKTHVTDVIKDGDQVVGVEATHFDQKIRVNAKIVFAADGVDSLISKKAGLDTVNHLGDYHSGFQYEMAGVDCQMDNLYIFVGNEIAPMGYAWIFPKGNTIANVGIGILGTASDDGHRAKDLLDKFIVNNPKFFGRASPIEANGGGIPVSVASKTFVGNGIMAMGDAAQQVNPIHGGGIALAMMAAKIASDVAVEALKEGDFSAERFAEYERRWYEVDGNRMKKLHKVRSFIEKLEDKDLEVLADFLTGDDIMAIIVEGNYGRLLKKLIIKAPKLLSVAKKFF